jgi:hypothetical protein
LDVVNGFLLISLSPLGTINNNTNFSIPTIQDTGSQFYVGIIGIILGAFLTYVFAFMIERRRENTQKKKDNELKERIVLLIKNELDLYSRHITIQYNALVDGVDIETFLSNFATLAHHYDKMTPDTKAMVFDTSTLTDIDKAYREVKLFIANLDTVIHGRVSENDKAISKKSFEGMIKYIDKAIESISNMKIE